MNGTPAIDLSQLQAGQRQESVDFTGILHNYMCSTNWWAVFACFDLANFNPTIQNISAKLAIDPSETLEALSGLCAMGYLKKSGDSYTQAKDRDFLRFDYDSLSRDELAEQHSLASQQILNDLSLGGKMAVDHRCFATNDEILDELYEDILSALTLAFQKSQKAQNCNRVIKTSVTITNVLKDKTPRGTS